MVNTNQKPTIAIQNPKTNYQKNNQTTREETKTVIEKSYQNNQKSSNTMAISTSVNNYSKCQ